MGVGQDRTYPAFVQNIPSSTAERKKSGNSSCLTFCQKAQASQFLNFCAKVSWTTLLQSVSVTIRQVRPSFRRHAHLRVLIPCSRGMASNR
jgi:hypothetical protein